MGNLLAQKFVQFRLAFRARLPPRMNPNPLIRMLSNDVFDDLGEFLRVFEDIPVGVAGSN